MAMIEIFELPPTSARDFIHADMLPYLHSTSSVHPCEPAERSLIQSNVAGLHILCC